MGVSAGGRVAVGVWIDIVEDGPTMGACRTTGSLSQSIEPNLDDFGIWAKVEGGMTTVRRLTTDEVIVQARGWAKAMQALADKFGEAVEVSCDPGMGNAITAKMVGTWEPATAVQTDVMADVSAERAELEADPTGCGCELGHECGWAAVAGFPEDAVIDAVASFAESMGHSEISLNEWEADLLASEPKPIDGEASATQPVEPDFKGLFQAMNRAHAEVTSNDIAHQCTVPTPMRPARKGRVSRRGKTTRRQRARNRG